MKKIRERISSKLTFMQAVVGWTTCASVFLTILIRIIEDYEIPIMIALVEIVIFILMSIFAIIASYKLGENIIKRLERQKIEDEIAKDKWLFDKNHEEMFNKVKQILRDKYEIAKYDSGDVSEIFELYEGVVENLNQKLYVKLDSDNNICYAIIDEKGRIRAERKNRDYRFFLENIYVLEYFNRNIEL